MRKKARMKAGRRTTNAGKVRPPKVIRGTRHLPPAGATPERKHSAKGGPVVMNGIPENDDVLDDTIVVGAEHDVRAFFREALE